MKNDLRGHVNRVLKIVEDLADYIALGVTGEIEKRQWSGY
jgi:hypothetical protein